MPKMEKLETAASSGTSVTPSSAAKNETSNYTTEKAQQIEKPEEAHLHSPISPYSQGHLFTPSQLSVNACCAPSVPAAATGAVTPRRKRTMSKSTRIIILLVVDIAFFLLELVVGYAVHSLALVADAFHMLNDVLSLCVGLWAVKVANNRSSSAIYTYGWQRAETLGALINGVFLVAICLSIFLEAIHRFVKPQIVSNPKLVVIVGALGLASNVLGLVLFHDHGNSHGPTPHEATNQDPVREAEEGRGQNQEGREMGDEIQDEGGAIANVLPQSVLGTWRTPTLSTPRQSASLDPTESPGPPTRSSTTRSPTEPRSHNRLASSSFGRGFGSVDHILSHPANIRNDIIVASRTDKLSDSGAEEAVVDSNASSPNEESTLLDHLTGTARKHTSPEATSRGGHEREESKDHPGSWNSEQDDVQPDVVGSKGQSHAHSPTDLNIRGIFLHILGDALGNIGIVGSALFIWHSTYSWRHYTDPAISLVITIIILVGAIPLCKAASRILLQAVPVGLSVDEIKAEIEQLPGIISCHHLHVWQLSDTKIVASLHIQIHGGLQGTDSTGYMHLARKVRRCLHGFGIHSSTIQPEFCLQNGEEEHSLVSDSTVREDGSSSNVRLAPGGKASKAGSVKSEPGACLLDCSDECADKNQCCPLQGAKQ